MVITLPLPGTQGRAKTLSICRTPSSVPYPIWEEDQAARPGIALRQLGSCHLTRPSISEVAI